MDNRKSMETVRSEALFSFTTSYLKSVNKFELMKQLMECGSLEQGIKVAIGYLMKDSQFEFDPADLKLAAESYVIKCQMLNEYCPSPYGQNLSHIVLIKPIELLTELEDFVCQKMGQSLETADKVETYVLSCDPRLLLEGQNCVQCAEIMNGNLRKYKSYHKF